MFVYICVHMTGASRCDNCLAGKYSADSGMSPECQLCGRQVLVVDTLVRI